LAEVRAADLILHVRDITHPETEQQKADVLAVLAEIGLDDETLAARMLEVWNKADCLTEDAQAALRPQAAREGAVVVSALTGAGLAGLAAAVAARLSAGWVNARALLPHSDGQALAWLYQHGKVLARSDADAGIEVAFALPRPELARFQQRFSEVLDNRL
jgi:GTPase